MEKINTIEIEREVNEGTNLFYQVTLEYWKKEAGFPERLVKDPTNWLQYSNLRDLEQSDRLLTFLQDSHVEGKMKTPSNYPNIITKVKAYYLSEHDFVGAPHTESSILEKKCIDGVESEEFIGEYPYNGNFVRNMWFCDIIKGFDYEPL